MNNPDRLYELLPTVYRQQDAAKGYPLRALLKIITEQVDRVEDDIAQLYENWFIETCEDWVVPYIGGLVGYVPVNNGGEISLNRSVEAQARFRAMAPRSEVANTVAFRRRKGTLALLELLADGASGWPTRAVEFYTNLAWTQALNHQRLECGRFVDLRCGSALRRLGGAFDESAHVVDVRRADSGRTVGRQHVAGVGLFVFRLKVYSVGAGADEQAESDLGAWSEARCIEEADTHCFTFSPLGNNTCLYHRPKREADPAMIANELSLPTPIGRQAFGARVQPGQRRNATSVSRDYYGADKSVAICVPDWPHKGAVQPIPVHCIIPANLSQWNYRVPRGHIAVDPETGRLRFPSRNPPPGKVSVYYHYAFSTDMGGGEYERPVTEPQEARIYAVRHEGKLNTIQSALNAWRSDADKPRAAVIEITDSAIYTECLSISLAAGESLQIRAANRRRPVWRLLDMTAGRPDGIMVRGEAGSRLFLDGLLITGRGVAVQGPEASEAENVEGPGADLCDLTIRHCTLVPGWGIDCDCEPERPSEPSLRLNNTTARLRIEHSIIGAIQIGEGTRRIEPTCIEMSDSIWDGTGDDKAVLCAGECELAHARLHILRTTVFGEVHSHEITLAENTLFMGEVYVGHRQTGCVRFCYVPPHSRTPRRYECQPDLVDRKIEKQVAKGELLAEQLAETTALERFRVQPQFNSTRYGNSAYGQLSQTTAKEISRGSDDESEMGAFHDLFQPQRVANLQTRLEEYSPAEMDAGIFFTT